MPISFKSLGATPAKSERTIKINSTQAFVTPADVTSVEVIMCGGGGGGMNSDAFLATGAGGSGSVEYAFLTVAPSTSYTITIGAGGSIVSGASGTQPVQAGNSSFGGLLTVAGGWSYGIYQNSVAPGASTNSGRPGAKGGKGACLINVDSGSTLTAGRFFQARADKGYAGLGGGGGLGIQSWLSNGSPYSISNQHGADGGGSGGSFWFDGGSWQPVVSTAGLVNTGGGGGGGSNISGTTAASAGGSGVCIIKYWSAL